MLAYYPSISATHYVDDFRIITIHIKEVVMPEIADKSMALY